MLLDNRWELLFLSLNIYAFFLLIKTDLSIFHFSTFGDSVSSTVADVYISFTEMTLLMKNFVLTSTKMHGVEFKNPQDYILNIYGTFWYVKKTQKNQHHQQQQQPKKKKEIPYLHRKNTFHSLVPLTLWPITPFCDTQNCHLLQRLRT